MLYLLFKSEIYYTKGHSKQQNLLTKTPTVTPCACFVDTGVLFDKEAFVLFPLSFPPPPPPPSLSLCLSPSLPSYTGMALGYPPPSPVGSYAPLTPISMSAGIDLASNSGGGGAYSPPHNLSPKGSSSASVNGYNSQVRKI